MDTLGPLARRHLSALGIALAVLLLSRPLLLADDTALLRHKLLASLNVPAWHTGGFRGKGVKVAILDLGFRGYRTFLGKALPAQLAVRSFRGDGDLEGATVSMASSVPRWFTPSRLMRSCCW